MNDLRGRIAFAFVELDYKWKDIEKAAIDGLPEDENDRYQMVMGWAMSIKAYAKFLEKIIDDVPGSAV
jgi:hypothetical protein